jgi:restriction system protein
MKGPEFLKYVNPVLNALQANGGAGNSSYIIDQVIDKLGITEADLEGTTANGQSRIRNQIQWARFYLFKAGLIDNAQRGIWRLTNEGLFKKLDDDGVYNLFKSVQDSVKKTPTSKQQKTEPKFENTPTEDEEHSLDLINIIQNLSASGFEKLCKRLLTEIGINEISITGGTGDQGIDGKGIVKLFQIPFLELMH